MFAELDGKDWSMIIGAIGFLVMQILTWYKTIVIQTDVRKIEVATNSMKDDLVKVTGEAEKAKGVLMGRAEQKAEAGNDPVIGSTVPQQVTAMKNITEIKKDVKEIKKEIVP